MHIDFNPFPHRSTFKDLTGKRFGRWTVLKETPNPKPGQQTRWHCRCDCGKEKPKVLYGSLVRGESQSCGCLRMEGLVKPDHLVHSQRNPAYRAWQSMKTRCFNSLHPSFRHYGERGITVCPEWAEDFDQFLKDMGPRPKGLTLERIDNNGNYEPGNCKWGTRMEQAGNTRRNIVVMWGGRKCNLIDVARQTNVDYPMLSYRYQNKGMGIQKAVAELQVKGSTFHERATEAGSTRKNKTDASRGPKNFWRQETKKDLTGKRFGRWTVVGQSAERKGAWHCRCDCGNEKPAVFYSSLVNGRSESCGCLKREMSSKPLHEHHGRRNPTYRAWHDMKRREGVCPGWASSFNQFLRDMGPRPTGARLTQWHGMAGWSKKTCFWKTSL